MILFNRLFPGLGSTAQDALILEITFTIAIALLVFNVMRWKTIWRSDDRDWNDCVGDIRAMNTYNSYFMGGIMVFVGLVTGASNDLTALPVTAFIMLITAFLFAASAIFFFPIRKKGTEATSGMRIRWFWVLYPSQCTVLFSTGGFVNIALTFLTKTV